MKNLLLFTLKFILFIPLWYCMFAPTIYYQKRPNADDFVSIVIVFAVVFCGGIVATRVDEFINDIFKQKS